jgi:hypothetical protein
MRLIPALIGAGVLAIGATVVAAQTTTPAPTTNPNTKVYAYKKTAPASASNTSAPTMGAAPLYENGNPAPYGTNRWWEMRDRMQTGGDGGGAGGP